MRLRIVLGLLVVVASSTAWALVASASHDGPQLDAVGDPPSSLVLTAEGSKEATAELTVVVRNDSAESGEAKRDGSSPTARASAPAQ